MNHEEYSTSDLQLASFLISSGRCKLKKVRDNGGNRKVFVIEPSPERSEILSFYSGEATVSALKLLETLGSLKSVCYVLGDQRAVRKEVHT
ncbi:MAG: DUF5659 domain-containing protein [Candidatus Zixiibacteriota bacterium]